MSASDIADELLGAPRIRDLASLLSAVERFVAGYVVFPGPQQLVAVTLWTAHTHALDGFDVTPYLAILSPEKQSGKTRLLEVLELLVPRPWRVIQPSEAVLYRKIDADRPTLLLDEVDAIFRDRTGRYEPLRALLNAGYRRGVRVPRCVGEGKTRLEEFAVFCPKALAGIGTLPDTIADRSIPIRLNRRIRQESVAKFRFSEAEQKSADLRDGLHQMLADAIQILRGRAPQVPGVLNDRAAEIWEPLFTIADCAGATWPQRARTAAVVLHAERFDTEETAGVALLGAAQAVFETAGTDRIKTTELVRALVERDDGPWAEWWGKAVAAGNTRGPAYRLSRLLRPFGISPQTIRFPDGDTCKGYYRAAFEDTWRRYLISGDGGEASGASTSSPSVLLDSEKAPVAPAFPPPNGVNDVTSSQPKLDAAKACDDQGFTERTSSRVLSASDAACDVVTSFEPKKEGEAHSPARKLEQAT